MQNLKNRKLANFVQGRQLLQSQFQSASSMENKFQLLRSKINMLNPSSPKPNRTHKYIKSENEESLKDSEELYFKQLNKMYQGQEQYNEEKGQRSQANKKAEREKQQKGMGKGYRKKHLYVKSVHQQRKTEWEGKKFIVMPNFHQILKGCSIGYAGEIERNLLKKGGKVLKERIIQKENRKEMDSWTIKKLLKSRKNAREKIQGKIKNLKSKAKQLYNASFRLNGNQFSSPFFAQYQQLGQKQKQKGEREGSQQEAIEKQIKHLRKLTNTDFVQPIQNSVPAFLMTVTTKSRPASVPLFAKFRFKSLYFRV